MTKGEETRQRIVEKAAALLNQRGFSGFSMSALMEATGLEKGGIYRHFDSKEQLTAEAFEYAWQAALGTRMRDLESISNSIEWLRQFITNFVQRRSTVPGGCPLFNTAVDADDGNPVLRQLALRALRGWRDDLVRVVKGGIECREIKRETNPKELADIIISSLEGALMMSRLEGDKEAMLTAQSFLNSYLDTQIRLRR
jgi:TetR/AcrR family transcriptional regulator, transcriptional repressor for nem operon